MNTKGGLRIHSSTGCAEASMTGQHNAYLGISFSKTRYFSSGTINQYAQWVFSHFDRLQIIIADHLEVHNQMVFKVRPYEEASTATRLAGSQYRAAYLKAIPQQLHDRLDITLASELLAIPQCGAFSDRVKALYYSRNDFRDAVCDTVQFALEGKLEEHFGSSVPGETFDILSNYFLEELAIILYTTCYSTPGYQVSIFPYPPPELIIDFYSEKFGAAYEQLMGIAPQPYQAIQLAF